MTNSPLGKYAPATAALAAAAIIGAWIVSEILYGAGLMLAQPAGLKEAALLAIGAVFGSAVAVNGYRAPLEAAHHRLDMVGAPPADASGAVAATVTDEYRGTIAAAQGRIDSIDRNDARTRQIPYPPLDE